jgi:hypothetical protein
VRWLGLLVILTACQNLFKLDHVDGPADARTVDAPIPVADAVAPACWNPALTGNDDGDAFIDGCDPCPGNPDMTPTDSDGDGIPDVCDPEVGHNTILGFFPFDRIDNFTITGGTWAVQGTDVVQTDPAASAAYATFSMAELATTWVQVDIVRPSTPSGNTAVTGLYLATAGVPEPITGIICNLVPNSTATSVVLQPTYAANGTLAVNGAVDLGAVTEVWVSGRALDGACEAYANHTLNRLAAPSGVNRGPSPTLYTSLSTGRFQSMTLFSSAP